MKKNPVEILEIKNTISEIQKKKKSHWKYIITERRYQKNRLNESEERPIEIILFKEKRKINDDSGNY